MKNLAAVLSVELVKTRKSKILPATLLVFAFIPLMMGLMMFVSRNPEIAAKLGMIGTKAKLFGENDWTGYFSLLNQMIASIGLIGSGFVTAWTFSREHSDRIMKDILALPVPRSSIALAKLAVVMGWFLLLALNLYGVGFALGLLMHLPGWSELLFMQFTGRLPGNLPAYPAAQQPGSLSLGLQPRHCGAPGLCNSDHDRGAVCRADRPRTLLPLGHSGPVLCSGECTGLQGAGRKLCNPGFNLCAGLVGNPALVEPCRSPLKR